MSKNNASTAKPNFLTTALWALMIFSLFNMFFNKPQSAESKMTVEQLRQELNENNKNRLDITIATKTLPAYNAAVDGLFTAKKLTPAERDAKKIEAAILVADTQLKAGLHSNDTNRIRTAFYSLVKYQRDRLDQPDWNKTYSVPSEPNFGWSSWSGQKLYEKVRTTLAARNRTDLVWGFIPGYQIVDFLVSLTGRNAGFSYAFAGFLLALLVRTIVFPLSQKQIMYGRQMSQLSPLIKEIKDKFGDDQLVVNQKTMDLYKEYGVNPMAGCAPAFVQMPFFFAIYQCMLHYQFTFEQGTFLWINPALSKATHGFVAANLGQMDAILTVIYGITMIISTLLTPVTDPTQVKQQRLMGVGMAVVWTGFMFAGAVPVVSGFVLYWTFTNCLATAQALRAYRLPLPPLVKVNTKTGGVRPQNGFAGKWAKWAEDLQRQAEEAQRNQPPAKGSKGDSPSSNGVAFLGTGETKTGTPAKHKPKKRKQ